MQFQNPRWSTERYGPDVFRQSYLRSCPANEPRRRDKPRDSPARKHGLCSRFQYGLCPKQANDDCEHGRHLCALCKDAKDAEIKHTLREHHERADLDYERSESDPEGSESDYYH